MTLPKRHAGFHQSVGEVGGAQRGVERGTHAPGIHAQRGHGPGGRGQHEGQGVERVEQQRLVFLEVLAVPRGQALQSREEGDQVAQQPTRLGPRQLEDVRVALLRHQARAGAEVVR